MTTANHNDLHSSIPSLITRTIKTRTSAQTLRRRVDYGPPIQERARLCSNVLHGLAVWSQMQGETTWMEMSDIVLCGRACFNDEDFEGWVCLGETTCNQASSRSTCQTVQSPVS